MTFESSLELRREIVLACRVLTYFGIVEGFGHVSARVPGSDRIIITPRIALGLVEEKDLCEFDPAGKQVAGDARPPLETAMHLGVYKARPDAKAIVRGHPRCVAAYACAGEPLKIAHGFGANLGPVVPVYDQPFLVAHADMGAGVAKALGDNVGVILQSNGMLAAGQSVPHASVLALFMEEAAQLQLLAQGAGMTPKFYSPEGAARRHGDDREHEPIRAWDYYVAVTEGRIRIAR
ncbi:MAG: class II aldolase/adducin family protein [Beijerinckiaceae bacterium]